MKKVKKNKVSSTVNVEKKSTVKKGAAKKVKKKVDSVDSSVKKNTIPAVKPSKEKAAKGKVVPAVKKENAKVEPKTETAPKVTSVVKTPVVKTPKKKIIISNRQITTGSTHGKLQQRTTGSRIERNGWGHFEGTIGAKIDNLISKSNFTKAQNQSFAGTKMSKVNSHIHHLRKEKNFTVNINKTSKIVSFG